MVGKASSPPYDGGVDAGTGVLVSDITLETTLGQLQEADVATGPEERFIQASSALKIGMKRVGNESMLKQCEVQRISF